MFIYLLQLERKFLSGKKDERLTDLDKDVIGHFILRLAYCKTEDLRRWYENQKQWKNNTSLVNLLLLLLIDDFLINIFLERFLTQEMALFKFRLERISHEQRKSFMSKNDLDFMQVSPQELIEKRDILMTVTGIQTVERYEREEFFKCGSRIHTYITINFTP